MDPSPYLDATSRALRRLQIAGAAIIGLSAALADASNGGYRTGFAASLAGGGALMLVGGIMFAAKLPALRGSFAAFAGPQDAAAHALDEIAGFRRSIAIQALVAVAAVALVLGLSSAPFARGLLSGGLVILAMTVLVDHAAIRRASSLIEPNFIPCETRDD